MGGAASFLPGKPRAARETGASASWTAPPHLRPSARCTEADAEPKASGDGGQEQTQGLFPKRSAVSAAPRPGPSPWRDAGQRALRTPWLGFVLGISRPHGGQSPLVPFLRDGSLLFCPHSWQSYTTPVTPSPRWEAGDICAAGPTRKACTRPRVAEPGSLSFKASHGRLVPTPAAAPVLMWFRRHPVATDPEH